MKRSMFRSIGRVAVGLVCVVALAAAPSGCICVRGGCKPCCAKKCGAGCTKPCCKKAEGKKCPPGCTKPCCKNV